MKLTEQDIKLFDSLSRSEVGKQLSEFLGRLEGEICDVRNWGEKDTVESARQAAHAIRELRTRLNTQVGKQSVPSEYI